MGCGHDLLVWAVGKSMCGDGELTPFPVVKGGYKYCEQSSAYVEIVDVPVNVHVVYWEKAQ